MKQNIFYNIKILKQERRRIGEKHETTKYKIKIQHIKRTNICRRNNITYATI